MAGGIRSVVPKSVKRKLIQEMITHSKQQQFSGNRRSIRSPSTMQHLPPVVGGVDNILISGLLWLLLINGIPLRVSHCLGKTIVHGWCCAFGYWHESALKNDNYFDEFRLFILFGHSFVWRCVMPYHPTWCLYMWEKLWGTKDCENN